MQYTAPTSLLFFSEIKLIQLREERAKIMTIEKEWKEEEKKESLKKRQEKYIT